MLTTDYEVVSNGEKDTVVIRPSIPNTSRKKQKAKQSQGVVIQFFEEKEFQELKTLERAIRASLDGQQIKSKFDLKKQTYSRLMRMIEGHKSQYSVKKKESVHKIFGHFVEFDK